ncbi:potassium-transporting ATPase subunit KdpC [Edaphobacter sp. HDX4]|uniref:potassium-transporting ATPase subunit KdpC n=1 Tax=Edaphobacter sp. HDX4 TaxID=2794064 RepID=UPI002FE6B138
MKKHLITACLYTLITAVGLGLVYPAVITGISKLAFRDNADGQLIRYNGKLIGSRIIGQPFTGPGYFHSRPSAAGLGYDASASSGSNLAPTNKALPDRVAASVAKEKDGADVPVDLVTTSGSGLDPDISPETAFYQVDRVAKERHLSPETVRSLVQRFITPRQFGLLGEPRVNVLQLNLALHQIVR